MQGILLDHSILEEVKKNKKILQWGVALRMKLYTRQFIVVANFGWRRENMRLIEILRH